MELENRLYLGDCLEILSQIPDNTFDHFISDVPYKTISGGQPDDDRRPSGILEKNNGKIFTHNNAEISSWLPEIRRVVKPSGNFLIFTNLLNLYPFILEIEKQGLILQDILLWTKNNVTPNRWYMKQAEYILWATERTNFEVKKEYIYPNTSPKLHPTEKPIELMSDLVLNFSQPQDFILDCFCGSGSTLIAAQQNNRKFFGCEIDKTYYDIAKTRLEQ